MHTLARVVCLIATLLSTTTGGAAQTAAGPPLTRTAPITYTGTVTALDPASRLVTTRGNDGVSATWEFPPNVPQAQVDAIRVGQILTVIYSDAIGLRQKPVGEPIVDSVEPTSRLRTATVTISAVDIATSSLTFTGRTGRTFTRRVVDPADLALLRTVAVGDRVDVRWYETMEIVPGAVASAPPVAALMPIVDEPDPDTLRDRLSLSVLWGVDNQFSGKMIEQANGSTTGGVPIRLDETTFDEVYGRMGLFKVGVGYRMSPRSEANLNFVISRSSSQLANVGTLGAGTGVPIFVAFGDYNYWGVEGGQRFFFAQTRFTPFVGYVVGLNRFDDTRGEFINIPDGFVPGYVDQDRKFFEKSWAFSFGPTAGVLVGVGPIELMGEVALRYMGGLSDVDWLVEEGLRDINSESSRWSLPMMIGARVRF